MRKNTTQGPRGWELKRTGKGPVLDWDGRISSKDSYALERRVIKAGEVRDGRVEIVSGLAPGDQVVTGGQNKVDQGSKVVINNSIALKATDSSTMQ